MARLPKVTREAVPEELREAFAEVVAANGGTLPGGPGSVAINSPELARRRGAQSRYLRFETSIPPAIVELAMLTTARCMACAYVWNAHLPEARRAGVTEEVLLALRDDEPLPAAAGDGQSAVVEYGRELMRTHKVGEGTFQAALDAFGPQRLVEITAIMGLYAQNAFFLNAFAVDLPSDLAEPRLR